MKLSLRAKIVAVTLVLSLLPVCLLTVLSVRNMSAEVEKVVGSDMLNMSDFVWQILDAHERLVGEAEIGDEIVLLLQAREQEKVFSLKEDEASVTKWKETVDKLKASPIWAGKIPEQTGKYEDVFVRFTKGKLADIRDLDKTSQALEVEVKQAAKIHALSKYQEAIKTRLMGSRGQDGARDLSKGMRIGKSGFVYFLRPDGQLVGHPTLEGSNASREEHIAKIAKMKTGEISYEAGGQTHLAYFRYHVGWDWIVVMDVMKSELINTRTMAVSSAVLMLCIALVVILVAYGFARSLVSPLNAVIAGLNESAKTVSSASGQISGASQELAQGASEQASSLEETSSALEEMVSMTRQNADNANQANGVAKQASDLANEGVESMQKMTEAIDKIKASAAETAKIIKTIDEVAFQTNLLALNAAVEAARAGEAGKGFAVVAEEVRNLARRSAEAAKNTADLIEGAQKNAEAGVQVTAEVARNLADIKDNAGKVATLIAEIAAASKEQSQGIDQVNTAVSEMDKVVQQNAANAEESASASEELSSQAEKLNGMVGELTAMVTGHANTADQNAIVSGGSKPKQTAASGVRREVSLKRQEHKMLAENKGRTSVGPQSKAVKPEEVIPLDDSDIKGF
jgi:ABC-type transporter Mla subunit MlaD